MAVKFKKGYVVDHNNKNISSLSDAIAEDAKCGCAGYACCPCPHYVLDSLDENPDLRMYMWNLDGTKLEFGDKATFEAACKAAK